MIFYGERQGSEKMETLNKLKNGEYSLAKTYWLFGVLGNLPFNIYFRTDGGTLGLIIFVLLLALAYNYFWITGCWKAATNYEGLALWAILAKIVCVLTAISWTVAFITLFSL